MNRVHSEAGIWYAFLKDVNIHPLNGFELNTESYFGFVHCVRWHCRAAQDLELLLNRVYLIVSVMNSTGCRWGFLLVMYMYRSICYGWKKTRVCPAGTRGTEETWLISDRIRFLSWKTEIVYARCIMHIIFRLSVVCKIERKVVH